ncbi:MAG: hypothetical protein C5B45_00145 [Chlamydiae bacterium]|nr:MAG: hypothetical protein C5B45_00145 [Chlamydiota bacterium]
MATLIESNRYMPSAPPPSYDEATANGASIPLIASSQSLEAALIEVGLNSPIQAVNAIAQNHITPKQPNLATRLKNFFTEKWNVTKTFPQAGANKGKNIFHSIYQHPTIPYIGAGLLGAATGLFMGLSIPAGFMLGVAVKLGSIGLDKGLDAMNSATNRVFNWMKGSKSQAEDISQSSFNQTMRIVPIATLSFSLGLNSYTLAAVAKIAAVAVVIGAGAFALGTTLHAQ